MLQAVPCPACGARIREDRVHCLRCGAPLSNAPNRGNAHGATHRGRRRWVTIAAIAFCVGLGGFAAAITRPTAATPIPAVTAAVHDSQARRVDAAPLQGRPEGRYAARDATAAGSVAYRRGDVATATEQFTEAIAADPGDATALNNLGQVLVRAGRARDAVQYFDRAIAVAPRTWAYQFNRARAFAQLQEWEQAIAGYRRALELFPNDYATEFNLAKSLQASGDMQGALMGYERAIGLAPGETDFLLAYGAALESAGRQRDAASAYARYLELEPAAAEAEKIKGRIARLQSAP